MKLLAFLIAFCPLALFAQDTTIVHTTGPLEPSISHEAITFGQTVEIEVFDDYGNHLQTVFTDRITADDLDAGGYYLKVGEQDWGIIVRDGIIHGR